MSNISLTDGHIDNAEHCVCCGAVIPEGRQVCIICGLKTNYKQSTTDVVEVVRCKDCKYSRPRNKSEKNIYFEDVLICESCEMADEPCAVCETDFCSYGELKEREGK